MQNNMPRCYLVRRFGRRLRSTWPTAYVHFPPSTSAYIPPLLVVLGGRTEGKKGTQIHANQ